VNIKLTMLICCCCLLVGCASIGATGQQTDEGKQICPHCSGEGVITEERICPRCRGEREVVTFGGYRVTCDGCRGSGIARVVLGNCTVCERKGVIDIPVSSDSNEP